MKSILIFEHTETPPRNHSIIDDFKTTSYLLSKRIQASTKPKLLFKV